MDQDVQAQYAELEAQFNEKVKEAYQLIAEFEAILGKAAALGAAEASKAAEEAIEGFKAEVDKVGNMTLKDLVAGLL